MSLHRYLPVKCPALIGLECRSPHPPPPHLSHGLLALARDGSGARQKPKRRLLPTTQKLQDRPERSIAWAELTDGKLRLQGTRNLDDSANWAPKRPEPGLGFTAASGKLATSDLALVMEQHDSLRTSSPYSRSLLPAWWLDTCFLEEYQFLLGILIPC